MRRSCGLALAYALLLLLPLYSADTVTVITTDGFVIQGEYAREMDTIYDGGRPIRVAKTDGFDIVMDGPKFVIFSTHSHRGAKIDKDIPAEQAIEYTTKLKTRFSKQLRPIQSIEKITDFNADWQRTLETLTDKNQKQLIKQQVIKLSPYLMLLDSPTDNLSQGFHTYEQSPETIRKLLSLHPDLREEKGQPDPEKRLKIVEFLNEVGRKDQSSRRVVWIHAARAELEKTKKEIPAPWSKTANEAYERTVDDLDKNESRFVIEELEAALTAGRYGYAQQILRGYELKASEPTDRTRMATVKATLDSLEPRYEKTKSLLRNIIEAQSGMRNLQVSASIASVASAIYTPRPVLEPKLATLLNGAAVVLTELHPDTANRLELFYDLARQAEARETEGKTTRDQPENLLAYAVSGWVKGKNGADRDVDAAVRCWELRELALNYLQGETSNQRIEQLLAYQKKYPAPPAPDELTQIITLLPPPLAADLQQLPGVGVDPETVFKVTGIQKINTGPLNELGKGVDFCYRLPAEYQHGRLYPILIALPSRDLGADKIIALFAEFADRYGYILVAPDWINPFSTQAYDYSGKDHIQILAPLREMLRRFQADPDRVFLFGYGEGANFAMDVGLSHPDRFAGLAGFGPNPPLQLFFEFWRNNQKLPTYFVTGELSGAFQNLRKIFERWMPRGFPAMLTVYRGRGIEWYSAEVPRLFDWMNRKVRARGTAVLRLNSFNIEPWQVLREGNDRYYWVGVSPGGTRSINQVANGLTKPIQPLPQFTADVGRNGVVSITQAIGIRKFTIWLERDLIDWSKPLKIMINGSPPLGYTPKIMTPDLNVMFEELYRTGDKRLLFLGKVEVQGPG